MNSYVLYDALICLYMLCLCLYVLWLCLLLTNPSRYLMFGMIVSILSNYRTNKYCVNLVHLGSWEYWLSLKGRVPGFPRRQKVVSPHSFEDEPLCSFMFSLCFRLYEGCTPRCFIHVKVRWFLRQCY